MIEELKKIIGSEHVLTDKEDILPCGFDGTAALKQLLEAVLFPGSSEEVTGILKLAAKAGKPLISRGSGTGLSGGSVPVAGGWVLCLLRLNRIHDLDLANLTLLADAGVITQAINERLAP